MQNKSLYIVGVIIALAIIGYIVWYAQTADLTAQNGEETINSISYACADGKTLNVDYTRSTAVLTLDDGTPVTLEHIGDVGADVYANDTGVVFTVRSFSTSVEENGVVTHENCVAVDETGEVDEVAEARQRFIDEMRLQTVERVGQPIEGFEPSMFMEAFPGLVVADFEGVEAELGTYHAEGGSVTYEETGAQIHSAARAITDLGMETLLANVAERLNLNADSVADVTLILSTIATE